MLFENFVGFSFSQNSCFGSDYFCSWPFDAVVVVVVVFVAAVVVVVYVVVVGAAVDVVELIAEAVVDAVYAVAVAVVVLVDVVIVVVVAAVNDFLKSPYQCLAVSGSRHGLKCFQRKNNLLSLTSHKHNL